MKKILKYATVLFLGANLGTAYMTMLYARDFKKKNGRPPTQKEMNKYFHLNG